MELYVFILTCVLSGTMLIMFALDWYESRKEQKTMFIKDKEWLLMEDNTQTPYTTGFAKAKYIRPGSYIQDISCYQPICDEDMGVARMTDNSSKVDHTSAVSSSMVSDNLKKT